MFCGARLSTVSHAYIPEGSGSPCQPEPCGAHQVPGGCLGPCGSVGGAVGVGGEERKLVGAVCVFPVLFGGLVVNCSLRGRESLRA